MLINFGVLVVSAAAQAAISRIAEILMPAGQREDGKRLQEILGLVAKDFEIKVDEIISKKFLEHDLQSLKENFYTLKSYLQEYTKSPGTKEYLLEESGLLVTQSFSKTKVMIEQLEQMKPGLINIDNFTIAVKILKFLLAVCGFNMIILNLQAVDQHHMVEKALEYQGFLVYVAWTLRNIIMNNDSVETARTFVAIYKEPVLYTLIPLIRELNKITGEEQRDKLHEIFQVFTKFTPEEGFGKFLDYNSHNSMFHAAECFFKLPAAKCRNILSEDPNKGINPWDQMRLGQAMLRLNSESIERIRKEGPSEPLEYWREQSRTHFNDFFSEAIRDKAVKEMVEKEGWKPTTPNKIG